MNEVVTISGLMAPSGQANPTASVCKWKPLIEPLLEALRWQGSEGDLRAALIYYPDSLDGDCFRNILVHLGFSSRLRRDYPHALSEKTLPAIFIDKQGLPHLLLYPHDVESLPKTTATLLLFEPATSSTAAEATMAGLRKQMARFGPVLSHVTLISLLIGIASLAPALFNKAVYDQVINSGASKGLFMLSVGVLLALAAEFAFRQLRNRRLSWFGARIDHYVSCSVFERLLYLPPHYTERAKVSSQLARLRDFEAVREFLTGPLATLFFELPLVAIYLITMAVVSSWLVLAPLALLLAFAILLFATDAQHRQLSQMAASTATKRQEFLLETVVNMRAIRLAGLEDIWQQRCRQISAEAAHASFRLALGAQVFETTSYVLMTLAAIATVAFGVNNVIGGSLSTGGLIAAVLLLWRIITPTQVCCASINRIRQFVASAKQIQHLLSVPPEHTAYATPTPIPKISGHLLFHRASLRYTPDADPALLGVTLDIGPGQIVAIRGNNGSGKSTLLKVLMGMYPIQSGNIRLDGVDIRQLDPLSLRRSIAHVPQKVTFFPGSIRDNLLLSYPAANENDCVQALADACALDEAMSLPRGLDTIIAGDEARPISFLLRQRLDLARAYVKPAKIYLFDEGSYSLGRENDIAFASKIVQLRGKATVLLVTHREDHMRLADLLVVLHKGETTHLGPPDQVLNILRAKR